MGLIDKSDELLREAIVEETGMSVIIIAQDGITMQANCSIDLIGQSIAFLLKEDEQLARAALKYENGGILETLKKLNLKES